MLEDTIEELTRQMIESRFKKDNEKYVISKDQLYAFSIKLIKTMKRVYEDK